MKKGSLLCINRITQSNEVKGMIESENHHFVALNEIASPGIDHQGINYQREG